MKIITENIIYNSSKNISTIDIEEFLEDNLGEIIRWAIVDVNDNTFKITVTYMKKED